MTDEQFQEDVTDIAQMLWKAIKDLRVTSQRDLERIQTLEKEVKELRKRVNDLTTSLTLYTS